MQHTFFCLTDREYWLTHGMVWCYDDLLLEGIRQAGKGKATVNLHPDPDIILRVHRRAVTID